LYHFRKVKKEKELKRKKERALKQLRKKGINGKTES